MPLSPVPKRPWEALISRSHARIQKVLSEGVNIFYCFFFVVDEGRWDKIPLKAAIIGSLLNAGLLGRFVNFMGSGQVLLRNPIFL